MGSIKCKAKSILLEIQLRNLANTWTPKNFRMQIPAEVITSLSTPCEFLCGEVMVAGRMIYLGPGLDNTSRNPRPPVAI